MADSDVLIQAANRIPVRNIWYILLYAWDMAVLKDRADVSQEEAPGLLGLLARMLMECSKDLLRKQLGRSYSRKTHLVRGIKGKIDLAASLKHQTLEKAQAYCSYDVLHTDTAKNQIIRSTIYRLARSPLVLHHDREKARELKQHLLQLHHAMEGISLISLSNVAFNRIQLGQNDRDYRLPLAICALVHRLQMPGAEAATTTTALLCDEDGFNLIFENFVRNFFRHHIHHDYHVKRETLHWPDELGCDSGLIPKMQTDITLIRKKQPNQRLIIDTKYTVSTLTSRGKFKSDNLYQLYSYLRTQEHKSTAHLTSEGMLLYPTVDQPVKGDMLIQGHKMSIRTIDLSQPWQVIEAGLLSLVGD